MKYTIGVDIGKYAFDMLNGYITITGVGELLKRETILFIENTTTGKILYSPGFLVNNAPSIVSINTQVGNQIIELSSSALLLCQSSNDLLRIIIQLQSSLSHTESVTPNNSSVVVSVGAYGDGADEKIGSLYSGSGEVALVESQTATNLSIGGLSKSANRIYTSGRDFMCNGEKIYMNGVNTPWHRWNEFGTESGGGAYNSSWWEEEMDRLVDRGVNSTRIWVVCSGDNTGVTLNNDGTCNPPTSGFWQHVDDVVRLATDRKIYLMPTMMSFDNFDWNNPNQEKWVRMLGEESKIKSFIDNYLVPFAVRYKDNPYVFSMDLCNEMDGLFERGDCATPKNGTCTPVGGGSKIVDFGQRVPDYIIGTQLVVNNVSLGAILERNSDTRVTTTDQYDGPSATFSTVGGMWGFSGWSISSIQRYLAMASAAIHQMAPYILITFGQMVIKNGSDLYDGDRYSDLALYAFTNDTRSKMDYHQIHWYSWAEPYYRLERSPLQHGLSEKPAIMGEFGADWATLNMPGLQPWVQNRFYNPSEFPRTGLFVRKTDIDGTIRLYKCIQAGSSGIYDGPTGTGSNIVDGGTAWSYETRTYTGNSDYNKWDMVLSDEGNTSGAGRIYICTQGGTSANDGGPYGTGNFTSGTTNWSYVKEAVTGAKYIFDYFKNNGWVGHYPWSSNGVDYNKGLYYVYNHGSGPGNYPTPWTSSTFYYQSTTVTNGDNLYICLSNGTSSTSVGPTGNSLIIVDGDTSWAFVKNIGSPPWTDAGVSIKNFSDENSILLYPPEILNWNNKGTSTYHSLERIWVEYGKEMRSSQSFHYTDPVSGASAYIGQFDDDNGIFLRISNDTLDASFVTRKIGVDTEIPRPQWSIDKLDGSGPSGITIDFSKQQQVVIDKSSVSSYKMGFVLNGIVYWSHVLNLTQQNSNKDIIINPQLRWEMRCDDEIPAVSTLKVLSGAAYIVNPKDTFKTVSYDFGFSSQRVEASNRQELFAIRIAARFKSKGTIQPTSLGIISASSGAGNRFAWFLEKNTLVTSNGTWRQVPNSGLVEYTFGRNMLYATGGGMGLASGYGVEHLSTVLNNMPKLTFDSAGNSDVLSIQVYNRSSSADYLWCNLSWKEGFIY